MFPDTSHHYHDSDVVQNSTSTEMQHLDDMKDDSSGIIQSTSELVPDRALNRLPFDVHSEIVSYLGRRDLVHLCVVSSTFLSIFRPFLYRAVEFDGRCSWIPTLDLLARDKALASAVVQLDFTDCCDLRPEQRETLNLVAIANLASLRRFRFSGGIFRTEAEENQFWRILASKSQILLEKLTYEPIVCNATPPWYGDAYESLAGLKIVEWDAWTTEGLDPLLPVLSNSFQTITSLVLPMFAFGDHGYPRLSKLHFCNLRVFSMDCAGAETSPATSTRITNFIMDHDTVEELCLTVPIQLDVTLLSASSLPRIRVFKGFLSIFDVMMSAQLTSLTTSLRKLALTFWDSSDWEIDHMFSIVQPRRHDAIPAPGCLSTLQQIKFSTPFMSVALLEQIIGSSAEFFGSTLDVLKVDIHRRDLQAGRISKVAVLFEPFKKLRVVSFTITNGLRGLRSEERALNLRFGLPLARSLFEQCATLREVRLSMVTLKHSWLITRTPDSRSELCPSDDCTGHLLYVPTRHPRVVASAA